jgi:hypothetical protein
MKTALRLSIPNPCQEKWETFSPAPNGAFCQSCSKTVVDFTKLRDDEVVAYLGAHSGIICGRFRQEQLKTYRELPLPRIYPGFVLLRAGIIWLLLALISRVSFAANVPMPVKTEIRTVDRCEATVNVSPLNQTVSGVVTSTEDDVGLPGVNVTIKGTRTGTITDSEGRFEIRNLKPGDVLVFAFIGLQTTEYTVRSQEYVVRIRMEWEVMFLGELLIEPETPATSTPSFWWRLFNGN